MKHKKVYQLLIVFILGILVWGVLPVNAEKYSINSTPSENITDYLEQRLKEKNVPLIYVKISKESPLEVEIAIQSISNNKRFAPDDFINLHLITREVVISSEEGYEISGLTRIVINQNSEMIDWGWIKIIPNVMYTKLQPSNLSQNEINDLVNENLDFPNKQNFEVNINSLYGFQKLDMVTSVSSIEEINKFNPDFIESLRLFATNMNSNGSQIVILTLKIIDSDKNTLVNYMLDMQFKTSGWWVAEGVNFNNQTLWGPPLDETSTETITPTP